MVLNVHRNQKAYQLGTGENGGKGVWRWGERERAVQQAKILI